MLQDYDYFAEQKNHTLISTLPTIKAVASYVMSQQEPKNAEEARATLLKLLKLNLWGNRVDLSVSGGKEIHMIDDPFVKIDQLEAAVLVDDSTDVWDTLHPLGGRAQVEFICDNAGYELYVDCCLADYLLDAGLAKQVTFNLKAIPWFVSDALKHDFLFLLQFMMQKVDCEDLQKLGAKLQKRLDEGEFVIHDADLFWTTGYEFPKMKDVEPNLYARLAKADLLIFKGDLNYRKLLSDLNWDPTTSFTESLKGFVPTKLCSLRTVKADVISGLARGKAEELAALNELWMKDGDYGVIQFAG